MAGVSARDFGGGFNTKGWQSAGSGTYRFETGGGVDEEAAKQIKPEKSAQDLKDEGNMRTRKLQERDGKEFEAARSEQPQATRDRFKAAAAAPSAALRKRELPKMLQVKKKEAAEEDSAAGAQSGEPAEKRARADDSAVAAATASKEPPAAAAAAPSAGGLLSGYASDSSSEEAED